MPQQTAGAYFYIRMSQEKCHIFSVAYELAQKVYTNYIVTNFCIKFLLII